MAKRKTTARTHIETAPGQVIFYSYSFEGPDSEMGAAIVECLDGLGRALRNATQTPPPATPKKARITRLDK